MIKMIESDGQRLMESPAGAHLTSKSAVRLACLPAASEAEISS